MAAKFLVLVLLPAALAAPGLATETVPSAPPEPTSIDEQESPDEAILPPQAIAKSQKAPDYPPAARAARFDGTVHLSLTILVNGTVGNVEVLECDHPNVGFEAAAIDAAKQWKFVPAKKDDQPVEYVTTFRVNFRTGVGGGPGKVWVTAANSTATSDDVRQAGIAPATVPTAPSPSGQKR